MKGLIKDSNNNYICDAFKINVYINSYFFDKDLAVENGDKIETIGICFIEVFEKETSKPEVYNLKLPVQIGIKFNDRSKTIRKFITEEEEFQVFTVYQGNILIENAVHVESSPGYARFLNFILNGKIPETVKYTELPFVLTDSARLNGVGTGVPMFIIEMMMTELARDKKDNTIPYRLTAGKTGDEFGYETVRMNDVPSMSSVFSALAFENFDNSVAKSIVISKNGKRNSKPPTEDILYY